jgi:hypothetical protein
VARRSSQSAGPTYGEAAADKLISSPRAAGEKAAREKREAKLKKTIDKTRVTDKVRCCHLWGISREYRRRRESRTKGGGSGQWNVV